MKRARFSEEQIIGILKAAEAVGNIRQACRDAGHSDAKGNEERPHCALNQTTPVAFAAGVVWEQEKAA